MGTEFGRGYATCLLQFVFHEPRLKETIVIYRKIDIAETRGVEIWANGASDHLAGLVTGSRLPVAQRSRARELREEALKCGHGFSSSRTWTMEEARGWIAEARSLLEAAGNPGTVLEAMDIDRSLGLRPELGVTCSKPIRR